MPPAARIQDLHTCVATSGPIVTAAASVRIGFQPAARLGDRVAACGGEIAKGEPTVIIEGEDAARLGDETEPRGAIVTGCPTVLIGSTPEVDALLAAAVHGTPFLDCKSCRAAAEAASPPPPGAERSGAAR